MNEEIYARQLYLALQNKFQVRQNAISNFFRLRKKHESNSDIKISIEGAGVHWHCTVVKGMKQAAISSFDNSFRDLEYKGPEYFTSFKSNGQKAATGRTFNMNETIEAVVKWLEGKTVEELYSRFNFIDEKKRKLEGIKAEIIKFYPQLRDCPVKDVIEESFSFYSLWFTQATRSCRIYYYGYEADPRYLFNWEDTYNLKPQVLKRIEWAS